jgi:hypothetical protein
VRRAAPDPLALTQMMSMNAQVVLEVFHLFYIRNIRALCHGAAEAMTAALRNGTGRADGPVCKS